MDSMTRKAFIGVAASAVGFTLFGEAACALEGSNDVLRPPLVDDEREFAARCLRCERCIEACPTGALVPLRIESGLVKARTPSFDFHKGACTFCNRCIDVCPTQAIRPADPKNPAAGRIGVAVVQEDRCIAFFDGCRVCVDSCPYGAIKANSKGHPVVDDAICNGCGACENACPALVYRSFSGGTRRGIVVQKNGLESGEDAR